MSVGITDPCSDVATLLDLESVHADPNGGAHAVADAGADAEAAADRVPEPKRHSRSDRNSGRNGDTHADADSDPERDESESWTRGRRVARFRRDDRIGCVDLAPLSELTASSRRKTALSPPLDRMSPMPTITRT
jgi:hypothetical protein